MEEYVRVYSTDDSAETRSARHREMTGRPLPLYLSSPERESFTATIFYVKGGQYFKREQEIHRWGGEFSHGEWSPYTPVTEGELSLLGRLGFAQTPLPQVTAL
jgi:hypothetical protein